MLKITIACPVHPKYTGKVDSKCKECHKLFKIRRNIEDLPPLRPYITIHVGRELKATRISLRDLRWGIVINPRLIKTLALIIFLLVPSLVHAQDKESQAYCIYVQEQAQAEAVRLRTPASTTGITQEPIPNGTPQKFSGITNSFSDDLKSMSVTRAAAADCKLYGATVAVQQRIQFALPQLERAALQNRLSLIESALAELEKTSAENKRKVDSQNANIQSQYLLDTARSKLVMDKSSTTLALSLIYVPETLAEGSIFDLAQKKQSYEIAKQKADNQVAAKQNWDVAVAVGVRKDAFPVFAGKQTGAYGNFTITYNLGTKARNNHLANAAVAYGDYKHFQQNDALQMMAALKKQVVESISAQEETLNQLHAQDQKITEYLTPVKDVDSSAAIGFRNQLFVDSLALRVEIGNAQFRLDRLKEYLSINFQ